MIFYGMSGLLPLCIWTRCPWLHRDISFSPEGFIAPGRNYGTLDKIDFPSFSRTTEWIPKKFFWYLNLLEELAKIQASFRRILNVNPVMTVPSRR